MHLRSQVKAGVLLYSLLMASIFILIVQVYIIQSNRLQVEHQAHLAIAKAYAMAEMTKSSRSDKQNGQISFNTGTVKYSNKNDQLHMQINVEGGFDYHFSYGNQKQENLEKNSFIEDNQNPNIPSKKRKVRKEKPSTNQKERQGKVKDHTVQFEKYDEDKILSVAE
ncbi:competence type IV pilus minor pilin ComGG [Streptococcus parauberis]|uniref:competence type IV pilus minor pilin ComGG n=1 Tax=Streptococcus parauberis TaxID=1348 RepID=UPI00288C954F|nr:competence type IV pilus minor pilin ComGG [Streptococcus parauberis]MDT2748828.1 competence type IV pilus minor pilin ComGG [Streptococcus parauberis]